MIVYRVSSFKIGLLSTFIVKTENAEFGNSEFGIVEGHLLGGGRCCNGGPLEFG